MPSNKYDFSEIIGVSGSYGKNIIKEWLNWLLQDNTIKENENLLISGQRINIINYANNKKIAIFENEVTYPGELNNFLNTITPTIGIITNFSKSFEENFSSPSQRLEESINIFKIAENIIYNIDNDNISSIIQNKTQAQKISWSKFKKGLININKIDFPDKDNSYTKIELQYKNKNYKYELSFSDNNSIEFSVICFCTLIALKYKIDKRLLSRFSSLPVIKTEKRLEVIDAYRNGILLVDIGNYDISSIEKSIDLLKQKKLNRKTLLILSEIGSQNTISITFIDEINKLLKKNNIDFFVGIGKSWEKEKISIQNNIFSDINEFLNEFKHDEFYDYAILLKGDENSDFDIIAKEIQTKYHDSKIEVDLTLIKRNIDYFRSKINPNTKIMALVKAFSYGNGYFEISKLLENYPVAYLAVAFADEGIELRDKGIKSSIMVMNSATTSIKSMIANKLEPSIYSLSILKSFINELNKENISDYPIHIKTDTGMHRLGFDDSNIKELTEILKDTKAVKVASVFSHLVGSDDKKFNDFSKLQVKRYQKFYDIIKSGIGYSPTRHILNSAGILRFPEYQFDMVRLGIGMYGLIPEISDEIKAVSEFKSIISQIHIVDKNETISYSRSGKVKKTSRIATIPVGYADGFDRRLGNGNWFFIINNRKAFTIGNVCMDMCMVDISDIEAKEGDEVVIFGYKNSVCEMAKKLNTIPYEIITGISQRIKRIYFAS